MNIKDYKLMGYLLLVAIAFMWWMVNTGAKLQMEAAKTPDAKDYSNVLLIKKTAREIKTKMPSQENQTQMVDQTISQYAQELFEFDATGKLVATRLDSYGESKPEAFDTDAISSISPQAVRMDFNTNLLDVQGQVSPAPMTADEYTKQYKTYWDITKSLEDSEGVVSRTLKENGIIEWAYKGSNRGQIYNLTSSGLFGIAMFLDTIENGDIKLTTDIQGRPQTLTSTITSITGDTITDTITYYYKTPDGTLRVEKDKPQTIPLNAQGMPMYENNRFE